MNAVESLTSATRSVLATQREYSKALASSSTPAASAWASGQRFAILADNGVAKKVFVEGPGEFKVSSAEHVLENL